MGQIEYSASEIRKMLQQLFPHRRLVLSQFTFFNQVGVAKASGETFRRGRRCYKLHDILPIAAVLSLKEEGIPLKNIESVPRLIQENVAKIFELGRNCRLSGYGETITLKLGNDGLGNDDSGNAAVEAFLNAESAPGFFWSFDVGALATSLVMIARGAGESVPEVRIAA